MSSGKLTGPHVKHMPRIAVPSVIPPPLDTKQDKPITIGNIPTTTVTLKSDPPCSSSPSIPSRKHALGKQSPFYDGVYRRLLFSLTPVFHYSAIPQGKSILFHYFRKAFPHEIQEGSSFILVDINDNLWVAPEVFLKWQQAVEAGSMKELNLAEYQLCISHIGSEYRLYYSLQRDSYKSVKHPAPLPYAPLPTAAEEDEEEEAFPVDNDENDPDFKPDK